ncbi:cGMP-dependent kinase 2 isoform X1 [Pelobates cultripes]|uniref:cGMP-dependent protein kinase n=1 Tax=Pelobates cultripes TaxID=61616 RepID=A0AAD1SMR4_PELCU|nr:cGMP-dependent kinase 2 isoform X1 [Pelobates cultripes]
MGNGSMKPKPSRETDGQLVNYSFGSCNKINNVDSVKGKVWELEKELKKKNEELKNKELIFQELQEQINKQTQVIADISEELQTKCVQLSKLQDVIGSQGGNSLHVPTFRLLQGSPTNSVQVSPSKIMQTSPFKTLSGLFNNSKRKGAKEGISAEPTSRTYDHIGQSRFSFEKARVQKDSGEKKLITNALNKNQFLKRLDPHQIRDMVECMYERTYSQGDYIIKQGEPGSRIFVLAGRHLLVIMILAAHNLIASHWKQTVCPSPILLSHKIRLYLSVSLLKRLPEDKLMKIADCLEVEYYEKGDYIIRQGEEGSTFFIIAKGKVKVTQSTECNQEAQLIKMLEKGDYFGEKSLISDDVRSANIIADDNVECLAMDREKFNQTVGTYEELQEYLEGYVATLNLDDERRIAKRSRGGQHVKAISLEMIQIKETVARLASSSPFENLEIITTLGVGGFGRVELVKMRNDNLAFALKCIKKKHIVENRQQEHIHSEKNILEEASSPFIVKLYRTFKDNKYVYMLLEACLGGELWSLLRDRGSFDETSAKFCIGCVTEAFEYLHSIGVMYRDLKPENLLLDSEGYVKLVDFGFAKKIFPGQKTWTFCGTPEYVAPEVILNKGHSFSVDFWSLGILLYELLTGSPPFTGPDQMMIYNLILQGIEKMEFHKRISRRSDELIRRLCRQNPTERLGNLKNGIADIKKHRWFNGFDWEGLGSRSLPSPLKPELEGPTDHSHFDNYPPDNDMPPDEISGWDQDF